MHLPVQKIPLTSKIQGTGLGMAITKNLVDSMGGTIDVKVNRDREAVLRFLWI